MVSNYFSKNSFSFSLTHKLWYIVFFFFCRKIKITKILYCFENPVDSLLHVDICKTGISKNSPNVVVKSLSFRQTRFQNSLMTQHQNFDTIFIGSVSILTSAALRTRNSRPRVPRSTTKTQPNGSQRSQRRSLRVYILIKIIRTHYFLLILVVPLSTPRRCSRTIRGKQ